MFLIKLSFANVLRNRKRTVSTLVSIMFGVSVLLFTNGFNTGMSFQWADSLISQREGHIKVRHKDFVTYASSDMERIVIPDPQALIDGIRKIPQVENVMQRVVIGGLVGQEERSTVFAGWLDDLTAIDKTLPRHGREIIKGLPLSSEDPDGVVLGKSLAASIGVDVGDDLVMISKTRNGDQSFYLVHVRGLVEFKNNPKEEQLFLLGGLSPGIRDYLLEMGQGASELIVRLKDGTHVRDTTVQLNALFIKSGSPWVAVPWYENRDFRFLMNIFNGIAVVIMIVLSLIVSFIVSGSVTMSILERTREIGTMRAGGIEKKQVFGLFYSETVIMLAGGGLMGLSLGLIFVWIGQTTGITLSNGFFEGVKPVLTLKNMVYSTAVPVFASLIVTGFPVMSSCRMSIVDSLNFR